MHKSMISIFALVALELFANPAAAETVYVIEDRRIIKTEGQFSPDSTCCYKENVFCWRRVPLANIYETEKQALDAYEWRLDQSILSACRRKREAIELWDLQNNDCFKVLRPGRYGGYRNVAEAEVKELEQRFRDRKQTDLDIDVLFGALYQSCTRHTNSASIDETMANLLMEARLDLQPRGTKVGK